MKITELKALMAKKYAKPAAPATSGVPADVKKTFLTVPFYTPSDDVDLNSTSPEKIKELQRKHKLMGTGDPITITKLTNRKAALNGWWDPSDFTYDAGCSYKAWTYTWAYLALTVAVYMFVHPLVAVPFAWKVGHNWGQYVGGLVLGKEDMKGKTMYNTI